MLADYFARSAVAAAQVIEGFDEERFRQHLERAAVGVSARTLTTEAEATLDLTVRLLARLYPKLVIDVPPHAGEHLRGLAQAINPKIELCEPGAAELGIVVADGASFHHSIYAGSDGWTAFVAADGARSSGDSANPFGAGAAACLAAAELFRRIFLPDWETRVESGLRFCTLRGERLGADDAVATRACEFHGEAVLAGAGAIGNGALWALQRAPGRGLVHVVDPEAIELSNLQRYVLGERPDENAVKVQVGTRLQGSVRLKPFEGDLAAFLGAQGYRWDAMLLALDSARDRVGAQASLPCFVANAWTQPGDLGVSVHSRFGGDGACVACMYLPEGSAKNEDQLVAEALGVPERLHEVRTLLYTGRPVGRPLLEAVANAIGRPLETVLPFEGRTVREFYVEGFCGGAVIPLGEAGKLLAAARAVHVPLAHQSALAGVLLAGALYRYAACGPPELSSVARIDVLRPVAAHVTQPMRASRDGRCICDDADFVAAWEAKCGGGPGA